jgi:hypothetical protein
MKITDTPVVVFLTAVVSAFVMGGGALIWLDKHIDDQVAKIKPELESKIKEGKQGPVGPPGPAGAQGPPGKDGQSVRLGSWTDRQGDRPPYKAGELFQASSDGFVAVFSQASEPATSAYLSTGLNKDKLETRARLGARYSGFVSPVAKGEYWKITVEHGKDIVVQWLPLVAK